ncbi:TVP38/TMEM64 family protein [Fictibacillus barbaricus]|uniref:TVP38/TMEM64 family membrane protein n=1 Tax=Fictibacillus barbaricus TaxID=182136 RepID=A0ABU1TVN3_9BACL|nr:VTT domain-containing protein [Fictibacillus barbaricus]MDR7071261.1 putative membrane protein YdjX (TVP38/TMEM64 family) [Fictibacillus barbaricus]
MTDSVLVFFKEYSEWAIGISLLLNIIIAVLGVVPSVFLTAANILFFGFWNGTAVSFAGESFGAVVSFVFYRKGFQNVSRQKLMRYPRVVNLLDASGKEAFTLIFSLRLLPFVPSGLVTFAAAIGSVSIGIFAAASSLGKIPALLLEAFTVYNITEWNREGKVILGVIALIAIYGMVKKKTP